LPIACREKRASVDSWARASKDRNVKKPLSGAGFRAIGALADGRGAHAGAWQPARVG